MSREDIAVLGCWECDSEALLQAVRCFGDVEDVRSLFGMWECDSEARSRNHCI